MVKKRHNVKKNIKKNLFTFNNAVLLALIFALIVLFKTIMAPVPAFKAAEKADLEREAIDILRTVTNKNMPTNVLESNELVAERVESLYRMDYNDVKGLAGIKSDFCIFFEDATGNIVAINGIKGGIGSSKIRINGKPCE